MDVFFFKLSAYFFSCKLIIVLFSSEHSYSDENIDETQTLDRSVSNINCVLDVHCRS